MANLHCERQELKPNGETNSSFLVLHPSSGVHTFKTVASQPPTLGDISIGNHMISSAIWYK